MSRRNVETRLTPFEHYMLVDDRPEFPMRFGFRMKLRGQLDLVRLRDAFNTTVREQPLFCATVSRSAGSWYWNLNDSENAPITDHAGWRDDQTQMRWDFDLNCEPGIRVSMEQSEDTIEAWVLVHHSCADARAVLCFLSDWFASYDGRRNKSRTLANPIEKLAQRAMGRGRRLWHYAIPYGKKWHRMWAFYANPIKPLRVPRRPDICNPKTSKPNFISRRIAYCIDDWKNLKKQRPSDATMNDVILALTFLAIKHWNATNGANAKQDWIRVAMPMDTKPQRTEWVTNGSSMVFLDRRADRINDAESLIADIHQETKKIKRNGLGFVFTDVLKFLDKIPGGMRLGLRKSFACTTVVSNLGVVDYLVLPESLTVETNLELEELDFLVPVRRGTAAAFGIATVKGIIHLCMNYDPQQIQTESANLFFDQLADRMADFLDAKSRTRIGE